ncbi:exodeoxyribonuclease V subunit gamma [Candidatus Ishikawella capsulata]|uniref:RecBCD enzyme subunit RecC n=1 Tax=Candidatus Ishikawaella capsulata Mpkobe TaxID=476281 RepID=C5WCE1_9ENTR|nr:exodeoxyribonuclease V subunit gamma [Candidatus Ishikawaella capsulata]BAH82997.1 RecBCD complex gamma chain [Candidatus Ishikawaella capsulata Mpkobe]
MFKVYHSNQLDLLKTLMANIINSQPLKDPFEPEIILVQSKGMEQWLQIELAKDIGISANIKFILPARFIWEMFLLIIPDVPEESAFTKSQMTWKLRKILPYLLSKNIFTSLKYYLTDDSNQTKLFQLSSRIADIFDQYLIYRPDWINLWEEGKNVEGLHSRQEWQGILWKYLVKYTRKLGQSKWHRANLYDFFIKTLKNNKISKNFPKRIFICGISALPPIYWHIFKTLGHYMDVHLLFTNPCREYWEDIKLKHIIDKQSNTKNYFQPEKINPLLASWGKMGRENICVINQMDLVNDIEAFVEINPDNLLHTLQADILNLEVIKKQRPLNSNDTSITFHSCHSIQRELEVLHDYLLTTMEEDRSIEPRDIIVMVTNIDSYVPFIQATFANAPSERYIPFSLSDRRAISTHPIILAFMTLLNLPYSRCTSEEIIKLLEVSAFAAKFSISSEDMHLLRRCIIESGIRWGLDDDNIAELSLPVTGQHTWHFGLKRMLLGYALDSISGDWQGILPYDESGDKLYKLVNNLAELLYKLTYWRKYLSKSRNLNDWRSTCREIIDQFFISNTEINRYLLILEEEWMEIISYGVLAQYNKDITISLLQEDLQRRINQKYIKNYSLTDKINFCSLMPMRTVPFKIVCLLGMNDSIYPRSILPLSFDLMQQKPRQGDRSRRDDDCYLFLEALVSTQQKMYISYIGSSMYDNTKKYPSKLVKELLEYINSSFYLSDHAQSELQNNSIDITKKIIHFHTRIPFAKENFLLTSCYNSFASEWLNAAQGLGYPPKNFVQNLTKFHIKEININQLLKFWSHPVRYWFNRRLGIKFCSIDNQVPNTEPFILQGINLYQIKKQILNFLILNQDINLLYKKYHTAGNLPYGVYGKILWNIQLEKMQYIAQIVRKYYRGRVDLDVNLFIGDILINGCIKQIQNDGILRWNSNILNINDGLRLWIEHLIYCALGKKGISRIYGDKNTIWYFDALPQKIAISKLQEFINGYCLGLNKPLMLLHKSGGEWASTIFNKNTRCIKLDNLTKDKAKMKLLKTWHGNSKMPGEKNDPYLFRIWSSLNENRIKEIIYFAHKWYIPLLQSNKYEKYKN